MATLSGQTIANTFDSILHVEDDTAGLVATAVDSRVIQDGVGQSSALALATDSVRITSTNKLYFNDAGAEEIHSASDGHLEVNSGTTLDITAPTVDINASTAVTVDGPAVTIADGTGSKPLIIVKNTANDTTGSELRFVMDKGSAGADGDDLGTISFYGDDAGQNQTAFAKIVAEVSEADETDEAGKLSFYVAESDGTDTALTAGLILEGEHATDGEIDVTIGAGASSTTTIAGDLAVTGQMPVGSVVQIQWMSDVTEVAHTGSYASTNLTDVITPTDANNDILVILACSYRTAYSSGDGRGQFKLERAISGGATTDVLTTGDATVKAEGEGTDVYSEWTLIFLDAPATASAITYTLYANEQSGAFTTGATQYSSMSLMEISAT